MLAQTHKVDELCAQTSYSRTAHGSSLELRPQMRPKILRCTLVFASEATRSTSRIECETTFAEAFWRTRLPGVRIRRESDFPAFSQNCSRAHLHHFELLSKKELVSLAPAQKIRATKHALMFSLQQEQTHWESSQNQRKVWEKFW